MLLVWFGLKKKTGNQSTYGMILITKQLHQCSRKGVVGHYQFRHCHMCVFVCIMVVLRKGLIQQHRVAEADDSLELLILLPHLTHAGLALARHITSGRQLGFQHMDYGRTYLVPNSHIGKNEPGNPGLCSELFAQR